MSRHRRGWRRWAAAPHRSSDQTALRHDLIVRAAVVPPLRDHLTMPQRRKGFDVDPALVAVVHAKERNSTVDGEHAWVRRPPANRVDSLDAHSCRAGGKSAERGMIDQLLADREGDGSSGHTRR